MTSMTPFDWYTFEVVMVAISPFSSVSMIFLPDMVAVSLPPSTVVISYLPPPALMPAAMSFALRRHDFVPFNSAEDSGPVCERSLPSTWEPENWIGRLPSDAPRIAR